MIALRVMGSRGAGDPLEGPDPHSVVRVFDGGGLRECNRSREAIPGTGA
jgi:hypothetical protein